MGYTAAAMTVGVRKQARHKRRSNGSTNKRWRRVRPTSWWLDKLRQRAGGMYDEVLDLAEPPPFESEAERDAAIRFFNAAYRAEESGLRQAHQDSADDAQKSQLAETAELLYGTALLAEGGALDDPARFAELLADRLTRTV